MNVRYLKSSINQQREEEKQKNKEGSSWKKLLSEREGWIEVSKFAFQVSKSTIERKTKVFQFGRHCFLKGNTVFICIF